MDRSIRRLVQRKGRCVTQKLRQQQGRMP